MNGIKSWLVVLIVAVLEDWDAEFKRLSVEQQTVRAIEVMERIDERFARKGGLA